MLPEIDDRHKPKGSEQEQPAGQDSSHRQLMEDNVDSA